MKRQTGVSGKRSDSALGICCAIVVVCLCYVFAGAMVRHGQANGITHVSSPALPAAPIPIGSTNTCAVPFVLTGAISNTSPTETGMLNRDGVIGACGQASSCAIADAAARPYQKYDFTNATADAQCVSATIDATGCTSDLYSAAYNGSFNSASICANYLGGMGFSTSGVFTYSFLVPASGAFSIVNTSVFTNALCSSYKMTVRPCSANVNATASLTLTSPAHVWANINGAAVITYALSYKNTGNISAVIPSANVVMTPVAQSSVPSMVILDYGRAGGIMAAGRAITENVAIVAYSNAWNLCLPSTYTLTTEIGASAAVYQCNWGNPDQQILAHQVYTGSLQPSPWLAEDRYAFSAQAGWNVTITVNTAYAATSFDPMVCISATPDGPCLTGSGLSADDTFICDFQPNPAKPLYPYCPMFSGTLPATADGLYYLRVTSYSAQHFVGTLAQYRASIDLGTPGTALCPAVQVLDNGTRSFLAAPAGEPQNRLAGVASTLSAAAPPVVITMPPLNPFSPACGRALLPMLNR